MEKLTIKHLAPYLPYGLNINNNEVNLSMVIDVRDYEPPIKLVGIDSVVGSTYLKPILRPLSDLTKEIEINGIPIIPFDEIYIGVESYNVNILRYSMYVEYWMMGERFVDHIYKIKDFDNCPYRIMEKLFEWHFDIYGLIEKGLAIDINTLK